MNVLIRLAINQILKWAYSLTSADFANAWKFVVQAQTQFTESADKKKFVTEKLGEVLGSRASARAINFLIELAVARLNNAK